MPNREDAMSGCLKSMVSPPTPDLIDSLHITLQKGAGSQRYISVKMDIPHAIERVWQLITNYEILADIIPNLVTSRCIRESLTQAQLELVTCCRVLNFDISLRLMLAVDESLPYQVQTHMIRGDLQSYTGHWGLESVPENPGGVVLHHTAEVVPSPLLPIALLERQLHQLLPINFLALRQYLDQQYPIPLAGSAARVVADSGAISPRISILSPASVTT
jgi:Polyketide cyclase / dehydrase and lipid transport